MSKPGVRNPNFSTPELMAMCQAVKERYAEIEGSFSFKISTKEKDRAWAYVTLQVNAVGGQHRTQLDVRNKFSNFRGLVKKKISEENRYLCGTGRCICYILNITFLAYLFDKHELQNKLVSQEYLKFYCRWGAGKRN